MPVPFKLVRLHVVGLPQVESDVSQYARMTSQGMSLWLQHVQARLAVHCPKGPRPLRLTQEARVLPGKRLLLIWQYLQADGSPLRISGMAEPNMWMWNSDN